MSRSRLAARKGALIASGAAVALMLAACGSSNQLERVGTYAGEGGVPAPFLDLGPLAYQVQLSRQLNPADTEDESYLSGLSAAQARLMPGEEWLAVFIQVYNDTGHRQLASTDVTLYDTQGDVYAPVLPAGQNLFVYRGGYVPAHGRLPVPSSPAAIYPTQGALLLFKIKVESLSNRPIELKIASPTNPAKAILAELDV